MDENNKPVEGATVALKKLSLITSTDKQGQFVLSNVPAGSYEVEITFIGYQTVKRNITVTDAAPSDITVSLQIVAAGLTDVVVVGYGTQAKRDVTGTISSVKGDDFKNLPVSNAAQALQGRASGVDVVRDDGAPGAAYTIRVRGTGTINNSDPFRLPASIPLIPMILPLLKF